ncbi:hypothetical protein [Luteolibacter sp. AS25]|uniref:hypothetical protein n=1 Tax=Luteolibacter sp. AS25 TaxID=3135776 RepID=UPI00398B298C
MDELENNEVARVDEAIVCGRFQPFHNEHLHYLLAALCRSKFLWIGITKPWRKTVGNSSSHREQDSANPYSFIVRVRMVRQALLECGVDPTKFQIIPFDFESVLDFDQYNPTCKLVFVTITDNWSQSKIEQLEALGKKVCSLYENRDPEITATKIRKSISDGTDLWRTSLPPSVESIIDEELANART